MSAARRILLVRPLLRNPLAVFGAMDCEPLELYYLAAACRKEGMEPELYDAITEKRAFSDVLREVRPAVVAVTGYLTQEGPMKRLVSLARDVCPDCTVVIGGVHAQLNYHRLYWPGVDYVFRSEDVGELAALLAERRRPEDIPGLCWRTENGWMENPYQPPDLDKLPLPERMGWRENARWFRYLDMERTSTLKTAASCPYQCSFCYGRNLHGGRYQARSLEKVFAELEVMEAENVFIVDSDFLLDEARVSAFLDGLEERGIHKTFVCYARADFAAAHPALMRRLVKAGVRRFAVGLEGIEDARLDAWSKGTDLGINEKCVRVIHDAGGECVALLLADPAYGKEEFRNLYRWVKRMGLKYVSVQVLTPIPPTPFYWERKDDLLDDDLRRWDLTQLLLPPEKLTRRQFMTQYRLLLVRTAVLGWLRGAYRFVTPAYLWRVLLRDLHRRRTLR